MTTAQVVKTPVTVNNRPIQDYADPNNQAPGITYEMTPGFKPFIVMLGLLYNTNFVSFYLIFSVTCKPQQITILLGTAKMCHP